MGKDMDVTIKSKGAGGQGKVAANVIAPSGKPVASKVETMTEDLLNLKKQSVRMNEVNHCEILHHSLCASFRWSPGSVQRPAS